MFGYVVAGLLVLVVSFALVVNADLHKKRGGGFADRSHCKALRVGSPNGVGARQRLCRAVTYCGREFLLRLRSLELSIYCSSSLSCRASMNQDLYVTYFPQLVS